MWRDRMAYLSRECVRLPGQRYQRGIQIELHVCECSTVLHYSNMNSVRVNACGACVLANTSTQLRWLRKFGIKMWCAHPVSSSSSRVRRVFADGFKGLTRKLVPTQVITRRRRVTWCVSALWQRAGGSNGVINFDYLSVRPGRRKWLVCAGAAAEGGFA